MTSCRFPFCSTVILTGSTGANPVMLLCQKMPFDLGQVGFAEEGAVARRLQVHSADFDVERIFLRSDDQVGADGAQFAIDLVADVGGDGDHGRRHGHAQRDSGAGEQFAPLLPPEGFVDEPHEHRLLLLRTCGRRPQCPPPR